MQGRSWAVMMVRTLLTANRLAHTARAQGRARLTEAGHGQVLSWYHGAIVQSYLSTAAELGLDALDVLERLSPPVPGSCKP